MVPRITASAGRLARFVHLYKRNKLFETSASGEKPVKLLDWATRLALIVGLSLLLEASSFAASVNTRSLTTRKSPSVSESQRAKKRMRTLAKGRAPRTRAARIRRHRSYERFYTSSFADGSAEGDVTAGEDPIVRQAAIEALGNLNGTVVAIEPTSGRILAMVNQKLALSSGAQPCSTIKLSTALAELSEGMIDMETQVRLGRSRMNLTSALAH